MEFQIRQSWGDKIYAYEYFEINDDAELHEIERKAIEVIKEEWKIRKKNNFSFSTPEKCKRKIKVVQWNTKKSGKLKDGIRFETFWR
jgi:hypothetical protein